ncbi:MAG: CotH kinase family protein, partial [Planctomycetota bacterium]
MSGGNFDNPGHAEYYGNYIDIGSFIDHHILVETAKNVDGFLLSTYLYKDRGGKVNMGPIWDYNGSLGGADYLCNWNPVGWLYEAHDETCCLDDCCVIDSCWRYRISEGGCEGDDLPNHYSWYERLFEDSEFLLKYADQWYELREGPFTTTGMLGDIDYNVYVLTDDGAGDNPVNRNYARWDNFTENIWPDYLDNQLEG